MITTETKKTEFKATITYYMKATHSDIKYVDQEKRFDKMKYEDTYRFDMEDRTIKSCINIIKRDMALIAGGGYDTDHIYGVDFEIEYNGRIYN